LAAWIPKSFDEACKRNAGRRKLHMHKRQARADRIVRVLASMDFARATELRETVYGWITITSQAMEVSKATASRNCALVRRIHRQFLRMFGRNFDAKRDRVVWTWKWDHYGFITPEIREQAIRSPWATSRLILADKKPKNLMAASITYHGKTLTSSRK